MNFFQRTKFRNGMPRPKSPPSSETPMSPPRWTIEHLTKGEPPMHHNLTPEQSSDIGLQAARRNRDLLDAEVLVMEHSSLSDEDWEAIRKGVAALSHALHHITIDYIIVNDLDQVEFAGETQSIAQGFADRFEACKDFSDYAQTERMAVLAAVDEKGHNHGGPSHTYEVAYQDGSFMSFGTDQDGVWHWKVGQQPTRP